MSYQILDVGASIRIVSEGGTKTIMKHFITGISATRQDRIRISMQNPLDTIHLVHAEVTNPVTPNPEALSNEIMDWVYDCLCCDCGDR